MARSEETRNLFETAGPKQTSKDFAPAADEITTDFGTLEFDLEAFPTEETARKLYDELDLQRATQAYMDFNPALSVYAIVKSHIRDFGFTDVIRHRRRCRARLEAERALPDRQQCHRVCVCIPRPEDRRPHRGGDPAGHDGYGR